MSQTKQGETSLLDVFKNTGTGLTVLTGSGHPTAAEVNRCRKVALPGWCENDIRIDEEIARQTAAGQTTVYPRRGGRFNIPRGVRLSGRPMQVMPKVNLKG